MNKTPWQFKKNGDNNSILNAYGITIISDTTYYPVVDLYDSEWSLIATAPELLEALHGLMSIAEDAMPDTYFQTDSRVNAARAAIAKARGLQ